MMQDLKKLEGKLVSFIYRSPKDSNQENIGILKYIGKFSIELHDVLTNLSRDDDNSSQQHFPIRHYDTLKIKDNKITSLNKEDPLAKRYIEITKDRRKRLK